MPIIGDRIKELRKAANKTQDEFAKMIGISRSYLGDLENNRKSPSYDTLEKLATKIGIPVEDLIQNKTIWINTNIGLTSELKIQEPKLLGDPEDFTDQKKYTFEVPVGLSMLDSKRIDGSHPIKETISIDFVGNIYIEISASFSHTYRYLFSGLMIFEQQEYNKLLDDKAIEEVKIQCLEKVLQHNILKDLEINIDDIEELIY